MKVYGYFRSSAAYRLRIALNLKALQPEQQEFIHLTRDGGHQFSAAYRAVNPQKLVPTLATDDGAVLTQSLAIIEWLDETHPTPPLLPRGANDRAWVRAFAQAIACDIHPVNNLRVLTYLRKQLGQDDDGVNTWYRHWIAEGLAGLEELLVSHRRTGPWCHGDLPTLADICLVPQVANAERYKCDLAPYPTVMAITAHCRAHPAFAAAAPERQPDAE